MFSAAVIAAGMAFTVVMVMMVAADIGVECQRAFHKSGNCRVSAAGHTAVELDTCGCQSHLGTAADAAADQNVGLQSGQDTGQSAVAAAIGVNDLGGYDLAILDVIDLKLLGVAEMLEDLTVFISNCDFHNCDSFLWGW